MKTTISILFATAAAYASAAGVVAQYEFNDNFNAAVGPTMTATNPGFISFTTHPALPGAQVARLTPSGIAAPSDPYFGIPNTIGANGGGTRTNQYTIIMDLYLEVGDYQSLLQTGSTHASSGATDTTANFNDGDWFIRGDGGMGISSNYTDPGNPLLFTTGWHRIALSIDTNGATGDGNTYRSYVDGILQNVVQSPSAWGRDGRYSLGSTFFVFADEDSELRPEWFINSLQIRDYAMSDSDVASLGSATPMGIPIDQAFEVTGYTVTQGLDFGGTIASLQLSDDNKVIVLCDENDSNGAVEMSSTSPFLAPSRITFICDTSASRSDLSQFTEVQKVATSAWESVNFRLTTLTDTSVTSVITSNASQYVSGSGLMKSRVRWIPTQDADAGDGWTQSIDQLTFVARN